MSVPAKARGRDDEEWVARPTLGRRRAANGKLTIVQVERVVVVIPAHNEADHLPRCLSAVAQAAAVVSVPVLTVVVLDACDDESAALTERFGVDVHFVEVDCRNVGAARAAGFDYARTLPVADADGESKTWYATTDADSRVDADWLVRQLNANADMVLGVVRVSDWRAFSTAAAKRYQAAYRAKSRGRPGHGHVHGANMGFRADVYWQLGGFAALRTGEDVDLVRRFENSGHRIDRNASLSVVTSARAVGRAPRGFAGYLRSLTRRDGAA